MTKDLQLSCDRHGVNANNNKEICTVVDVHLDMPLCELSFHIIERRNIQWELAV